MKVFLFYLLFFFKKAMGFLISLDYMVMGPIYMNGFIHTHNFLSGLIFEHRDDFIYFNPYEYSCALRGWKDLVSATERS